MAASLGSTLVSDLPDDPALAPVPKLDAEQLVRDVNAATQAGLEFQGLAAAGEVGAAFVRWPDGRDGVLTRGHGDIGSLRRSADILAAARECGLPVPAYDLIVELPDCIGIVQERLPGSPPTVVDRPLLEAMIGLSERFAGLLAGHPEVAVPSMHLLESGQGFSVHESLERYDDRTRRLLDWVHEVGRSAPEPAMRGDDLVHLDYHTGNALVDDTGQLTGIIDWDGIGRGDRRFGLVTLRFDVWGRRLPADDQTWFDDHLDTTLDPEALRVYWAAMSLRQVDWSIRHHTPAAVDHWLNLAETRID
jgi:aminoglycoside phosphotransferase (APT) family kinase protein